MARGSRACFERADSRRPQHRLAARRRRLYAWGDRAAVRSHSQFFEIAAGPRARAATTTFGTTIRSTYMHVTLKDLISVRDGEPVGADIAEHVPSCEECSAALAKLSEVRRELRRLPDYEPPSHGWAGIERQLRTPARARRRSLGWRATGWRARSAAAAAVGLALVFVLLIGP